MNAQESSIASVSSITEFLNANGIASFTFKESATILVKLILVMPATNALSERSQSALRRINNYLRSTMTQKRMKTLMLMSVYKGDADNLNLIDVTNDFYTGNSHRLSKFGHFSEVDQSWAKPHFMDTHVIRTTHSCGQFALSLGKESPYIFSKFNPLNTRFDCLDFHDSRHDLGEISAHNSRALSISNLFLQACSHKSSKPWQNGK